MSPIDRNTTTRYCYVGVLIFVFITLDDVFYSHFENIISFSVYMVAIAVMGSEYRAELHLYVARVGVGADEVGQGELQLLLGDRDVGPVQVAGHAA